MKIYPVIFSQQDYKGIALGTSKTATIGQEGCFCTTFATKAKYHGKDIDPARLNKYFTDGHVYQNDDLLLDNSLEIIYGDIKYTGSFHYETIPADLAKLKDLLADPATTVTLCISRGNSDFHFVEAVDTDGVSKVTIANSWSGKIEDFSQDYGDPKTAIWRFIVYKGPIATPIQVDAPAPVSSGLAVKFTQAITKANNFDAIADYFELTPEERVTTDAGTALVVKIKAKDEAIETMQKQRDSEPASTPAVSPTVNGVPTSDGTGTPPVFANNVPVNFGITPPAVPAAPEVPISAPNQSEVVDKKTLRDLIVSFFKILFI